VIQFFYYIVKSYKKVYYIVKSDKKF